MPSGYTFFMGDGGMTRKHRRQKAVSAYDIALAACEALIPTPARPRPDLRRAMVLARFAVAMTK
jgi:hypothetical protein